MGILKDIMAAQFPDPFLPREVLLVGCMMISTAIRHQPADKHEAIIDSAVGFIRKSLIMQKNNNG